MTLAGTLWPECVRLSCQIIWRNPNPKVMVLGGGALWGLIRLGGQSPQEWNDEIPEGPLVPPTT